MAGIGQRAEERFIEAFISQLAVKAFNEAVLLGLVPLHGNTCKACVRVGRNVVPINGSLLNPFEDRHTGELGSIV